MPELMQELQEIRTLARDFARTELRPHVEKWDHERSHGDDIFAQVAELGFFGMLIGDAHGGMGWAQLSLFVDDAFARGVAPFIVGDVLKIVMGALITLRLSRRFGASA